MNGYLKFGSYLKARNRDEVNGKKDTTEMKTSDTCKWFESFADLFDHVFYGSIYAEHAVYLLEHI